MEFEESLDLNIFDLGARHMVPALGRFIIMDPMADFVNYQSPYVMADNNPIGNIDAYGLGRTPWWLRLLLGGRGRNCSCKQRNGVIGFIGKLFDPKPNKRKKRKRKRNKNNKKRKNTPTSSSSNTNSRPRESTISVSSIGLITFDVPQPDIAHGALTPRAIPQKPIPEFNGRPITSPISFNRDVKFKSSSDSFKNVSHTEKTLIDLIKTLKEYPQLKVPIFEIGCYFLMKESWTITSEELALEHEQLHFDIYELYSRKIRRKFKELNYEKELNKVYQNYYNELIDRAIKRNKKYDGEVYFDKSKQEAWISRIAKELKDLKDYEYVPKQ